MFCPLTSPRIDRAEARQMIAIAHGAAARDASLDPFIVAVGEGAAIFAGPSSPTNKMIGVGFGEVVETRRARRRRGRFAARARGCRPRFGAGRARTCTRSWWRAATRPPASSTCSGIHSAAAIAPLPAGVRVDRSAPAELAALGDVLVEAFASPDVGGVGGDAMPPSDEIRRWFDITMSVDGFRGYVARVDGEIAGGAVAAPRRRHRRSSAAPARCRAFAAAASRPRCCARVSPMRAAAGCTIGVVVTQPGSKSQQNTQREGFSLLYARQLLVKPGRPDRSVISGSTRDARRAGR